MVKNCVENWIVARCGKPSLSITLATLLACGVLLLQVGCQSGASDTKSSVAQAEQQPAPPVASAVSQEPPTQSVSQETAAQAKPQTAGGTPKLEFKAMAQNFGDIGPETTHTTKFEFKNVGDAPLRILGIKPCCGGVTRGVKAGQEFAPGQGGTLEVEYRAGNYPGPLSRSIILDTNDPDQPHASLAIKMNVVYRIEHSPKGLSLFLKKENGGCSAITVKSTDGQAFSIAGFRATSNSLTAEFDPSAKATQFVLKPKADMEKLARNKQGQVVIALTHPECKSVTIPYDVTPEFSLTPQQFTLFNIKPNQPIQRDLWIMSNYEEDFDIETVSSQKGTMKVLETKKIPAAAEANTAGGSTVKTGARYQLRLEITPPVQEDNRSMLSDVLQVQIKGGEKLTVQCRGIYAAG